MDGRFKITSIVFRFCPGSVLNFLLFGFRIQGLHIKSRREEIMDTIIEPSFNRVVMMGIQGFRLGLKKRSRKNWLFVFLIKMKIR
ncbi:hypothetical protein L1987_74007 [Smallanthus sonchifolius]|uniref:Uncharacterized protein n=1 Tax=Smallanthus sonchifolius TaxID=185202 RepID=A0ACB9A1V1_9ASTR|nr:hypothetical protein L1987_74007 [Smallanthus sonchifolius]